MYRQVWKQSFLNPAEIFIFRWDINARYKMNINSGFLHVTVYSCVNKLTSYSWQKIVCIRVPLGVLLKYVSNCTCKYLRSLYGTWCWISSLINYPVNPQRWHSELYQLSINVNNNIFDCYYRCIARMYCRYYGYQV